MPNCIRFGCDVKAMRWIVSPTSRGVCMRRKTRKDIQSLPRSRQCLRATCFATRSCLLWSVCLFLFTTGSAAGQAALSVIEGGRVKPSRGATQASNGKIQHVVVIFQENRTPDNLFHGLPNADIANGGFNSKGQYIPLKPVSLTAPYDLDHSHRAFLQTYDDGKMDGANKGSVACFKHAA